MIILSNTEKMGILKVYLMKRGLWKRYNRFQHRKNGISGEEKILSYLSFKNTTLKEVLMDTITWSDEVRWYSEEMDVPYEAVDCHWGEVYQDFARFVYNAEIKDDRE